MSAEASHTQQPLADPAYHQLLRARHQSRPQLHFFFIIMLDREILSEESHYGRLDFIMALMLPMNEGSINSFIHHREAFQTFRCMVTKNGRALPERCCRAL
jgi:hypothetical protein